MSSGLKRRITFPSYARGFWAFSNEIYNDEIWFPGENRIWCQSSAFRRGALPIMEFQELLSFHYSDCTSWVEFSRAFSYLQKIWPNFPSRLKLFSLFNFFLCATTLLALQYFTSFSFSLFSPMKYFILSGTIATFTCSVALRKCPLKFPFLHPEQSFVINVSSIKVCRRKSCQKKELSQMAPSRCCRGRRNGDSFERIELNVVILVYWADVDWLPIKLSLLMFAIGWHDFNEISSGNFHLSIVHRNLKFPS